MRPKLEECQEEARGEAVVETALISTTLELMVLV
jgi:hypothetical protein